jgi:NAD(P)-dependent dehydrogenase (short-subunit alcohol dehydrogenase family)
MIDAETAIVILGATGGIGSALCHRLAESGARLVVAARDHARVVALASSLGAEPYVVDATQVKEVDACVAFATQRFGRVSGIASCVGSLLLKPAHLTTETEWATTLATNLTSAFAATRAGARAMLETGGSIVLVSSAAARLGLANHEAIAAAKAGITGLVLAAAASYGARGIRVNAVAPGLVRTALTERITASDAARKASIGVHALGRLGEPSDVASAIAWLLDPAQSWVTGQVLGIDGGLASVRTRGGA